MEDLLSKIYDKVAFYEDDSIQLGKEFDCLVEDMVKPLENSKMEPEIEIIKELIYKAAYSAEKFGFQIGVRFIVKLFMEMIGTESKVNVAEGR